jgi:hypothetical protein
MVTHVGYSVAGRLRGRVAPCVIYTVHVETRSASFLVEPQNQGQWFDLKTTGTVSHRFEPQNRWRRFVSGLASKPLVRFLAGLPSKPVATVSVGLASKPVATVFSGLASKPVATVFSSLVSKLVTTVSPGLSSKPAVGFLVEPQNQGGEGFPGLSLKIDSFGLVIWASKSPRQFLGLCLKTKQDSVCRLHHKIDRGRSAWDTRRDLATCFTWKQVWLGFPSLA